MATLPKEPISEVEVTETEMSEAEFDTLFPPIEPAPVEFQDTAYDSTLFLD